MTRVVVPFVTQPDIFAESGSSSGFGDITLSAFYANNAGKIAWGAGPVLNIPTAGENLGAKEWGLGPSFVAVVKSGQWVIGGLFNNIWSLGNDKINTFLFQPFINYNLPKGYYFNTAPGITANWNAPAGQQWTIPLGLAFGKVIKPEKFLPLNVQAGAYYNVEKPDYTGADWSVRTSITILIPKALIKRKN